MPHYIWQSPDWPALRWQSDRLLTPLGRARLGQGKLLQQAEALGFDLGQQAQAEILTEEAVKTAAIEGENLDRNAVRSSVARRMGLPTAGLAPASRHVEGLVEALLDATLNYRKPLTEERLKGWQAALFPTGYSGLQRIRAGEWRSPGEPMQVVSGPVGREKVHYEAPPGEKVSGEMAQFFQWWEQSQGTLDGVLRAGLAHFRFVTIHPFEDGNGRLARALTDMALVQDEKLPARFYSLSSQIMADRDAYYSILEVTQKGDGDITVWLEWFLGCFERAVEGAESLLAGVLLKARFWQRHAAASLTERQRKVLNRLLDAGPGGFEGGMTTRKYAGLAGVSKATAQREIADLLDKGMLRPKTGGGRSASYEVAGEA
ncbi:MAG: Fic family protein [Desulfuromonadales bacterium]|nr:Fic family protein [Desulfuromonadales bacterium]